MKSILLKLFILSGIVIWQGGCAQIQKNSTRETENDLSAAGFDLKLASTPAQLNQLATLPARTLVPMNNNGNVIFVYADPDYCMCIYVGSQTDYQNYRLMQVNERIATDNEIAASNWNWGPWGYDPWNVNFYQ